MSSNSKNIDISSLVGKTITSLYWDQYKSELTMIDSDGIHHSLGGISGDGGCVYVEDVNGNLDDLLNSPILMAEEKTAPADGSSIWSNYQDRHFFYEIATIKGAVHMRFFGEAGAYYAAEAWFHSYKPHTNDSQKKE